MSTVTYIAGDDVSLTISVKDRDGDAINLSGSTIVWNVKKTVDSASISITKESDDGIVIDDAVNGIFTITIGAADSKGLAGTYYHETRIVGGTGTIGRVRDINFNLGQIEFKKPLVPIA